MNYLHPPSTRIVKTKYDTQFFGAVVVPWIYMYVYVGRSVDCPDISLPAVLRFLESFDRIAGPKHFMECKTNYGDFLFLSFSFF